MMKRHVKALPLIGLALLVLASSRASAQTVEEIIEASLEASGGRAAFDAITSVRQTGALTMRTEFGDLEGDSEAVIIPNQKVYEALESDFFAQTSAWNGTSAWQSDSTQGLVDVEGEQALVLAARTLLHPFLAYGRPELLGPTEFRKLEDADLGGRSHHVVLVSGAGVDFHVFVDAETQFIAQIQFDQGVPQLGTMTITASTSDYQEHGGVMLPMSNTVDVPGVVEFEVRVTATEINGDVDHSIFEKP